MSYQLLQIQEDLSYVKKLMQILDWKTNKLRNKSSPLVKVLWKSQQIEEITWEPKKEMLNSYPYLCQGTSSFKDETSLRRVEL